MGVPEPPRHLNSRMERAAWRTRRRRRRAGLLVVAAAAVAVLAVVATGLPQQGGGGTEAVLPQRSATEEAATAGPSSTAAGDRPVNGGFDNGMTGWTATAGAVVSWQASGHIGGSALVRANPQPQAAQIAPVTSTIENDAPVIGLVAKDAAAAAGAGTSVQGTVWVRGTAGTTVLVRLTEHSGDEEVAEARQEVRLAQDWQEVRVVHALTQEDTTLDLEVLAVNPRPDTVLGIDSASVVVPT